jgi:CheY-like chemotaxis protein
MTTTPHALPAPILLVEDDENDAFFFERALKKTGVSHPMRIARDGQEAVHYLSGTGDFADRAAHPVPKLIVLDLNLPVKHGLEVLKWLRSQPATQTTVVVVLTSSTDIRDLHEAYSLGANSYLVKPADPNRLISIVEALKNYWLTLNAPPPPGSDGTASRHIAPPAPQSA